MVQVVQDDPVSFIKLWKTLLCKKLKVDGKFLFILNI